MEQNELLHQSKVFLEADKTNTLPVRHIKLGRGGKWEAECLRDGIIRLGFQTQHHLDLCLTGHWDQVRQVFEADPDHNRGAVTSRVNQIRSFFEDDGRGLWVTFHNRRLWWAFMDPAIPAAIHADGQGTFRRTREGWRSTDVEGAPLTMDQLSGNLTKVTGFQGTICEVADPAYVWRRINAIQGEAVARAMALRGQLQDAVVPMMRHLTPKDFELLVDLIFAGSGWRRQGPVGGTQKTVDMEYHNQVTDRRAFIQVKSVATQKVFDEEYLAVFQEMSTDHMFFAYHTGSITCDEEAVILMGPDKLAQMVLDAGLVSWLIDKSR